MGRDVQGRPGIEVRSPGLTVQLKDAGYDLAYGGKVHLPRELNPKTLGFEMVAKDQGDGLADACAKFVRRSHPRLFLGDGCLDATDVVVKQLHSAKSHLVLLPRGCSLV